MKPGDYEHVRLILRGRAASGITQADIQRRAREISRRRTGSDDYTAEDIEKAERELLIGRNPAAIMDDADTTFSSTGDLGSTFDLEGQMYDPVDDDHAPPAARAPRRRKRSTH